MTSCKRSSEGVKGGCTAPTDANTAFERSATEGLCLASRGLQDAGSMLRDVGGFLRSFGTMLRNSRA